MKTLKNTMKKYTNLPFMCLLLLLFVSAGCSNDDDALPNDEVAMPDDDIPMMMNPSATNNELIPLHFFVVDAAEQPIDPTTVTTNTELMADLGRKKLTKPDGVTITWGEWSAVSGTVFVECLPEGTKVDLQLDGLIPNGVYTLWNVTFNEPGFTGEFDAPAFPSNVKAFGPVGKPDGSESIMIASPMGIGSLSVITPGGALGALGEIETCALQDEVEWHVVGLYHSDGQTYGATRGPDGTHAEQFAFIFKN